MIRRVSRRGGRESPERAQEGQDRLQAERPALGCWVHSGARGAPGFAVHERPRREPAEDAKEAKASGRPGLSPLRMRHPCRRDRVARPPPGLRALAAPRRSGGVVRPGTRQAAARRGGFAARTAAGGPRGRHQGQGLDRRDAGRDPPCGRPPSGPLHVAPRAPHRGTHLRRRPGDRPAGFRRRVCAGDSGGRSPRPGGGRGRRPGPHVVRGHDRRRARPLRPVGRGRRGARNRTRWPARCHQCLPAARVGDHEREPRPHVTARKDHREDRR